MQSDFSICICIHKPAFEVHLQKQKLRSTCATYIAISVHLSSWSSTILSDLLMPTLTEELLNLSQPSLPSNKVHLLLSRFKNPLVCVCVFLCWTVGWRTQDVDWNFLMKIETEIHLGTYITISVHLPSWSSTIFIVFANALSAKKFLNLSQASLTSNKAQDFFNLGLTTHLFLCVCVFLVNRWMKTYGVTEIS